MAPFSRHDRGLDEQSGRETEHDLAPLVERLRTMDWPAAPDGARERCLEAILARVAPTDERPDGERA